jgi:hypothetical protein
MNDRDYQHIRGVNDVMVLMSCEDPMHWDMHGYQLGGTGRELPADDRLCTDFGAPMTPQEWDATIRKAAAAGRAVYAIPVKDDVVGRNVCLHFPTTPDREDTAP